MSDVPDLISIGTQSLVENALRLGISWRLRLATVTEVFGVDLVSARYDGDTNDIAMVSMVGTLTIGDRVYVIFVPPAGNFVVGRVAAPSPVRAATSIRITSPAAFTAETVVDTLVAPLTTGRVYKIVTWQLVQSTVAADTDLVRIREDSLTGTQLQAARFPMTTANGTFSAYLETEYTAIADGNKTFVVTGQRATGTGNISHPASATQPVYFYADYIRG